jgi:hypothetical protein
MMEVEGQDADVITVCVHSSFRVEGQETRESIEVRAMVFSHPEG